MPASFDFGRLQITHDPTLRLDQSLARLPKFDPGQLLDGWLQLIKDATGIDLAGLKDFLESLFGPIDWSNLASPEQVWGTVVSVFINPLINIVEKLNELLGPIFGGIDFTNPLDPTAVWQNVVTTFIQPLISFVQSILDPVTGLIPSWLLPPTNIGRLTGDLPTLVPDGSFDTVPQGDPAGRWFRDAVVGRSKPGALAIVGNGVADDIVPQPVGVAAGQKYRPSAFVSWSGGSGSAGSVQLTLIEFQAGVQKNIVVIGSVTPSGSSGFVEVAADYTVPSGVDQVAVVPAVTSGFTAGTAYFDDITGPSTGNILQEWVNNLVPDLASLFNWVQTVVDSLLGAFGVTGTGGLLDRILDLSDEVSDLLGTATDASTGLTNLMSTIFSALTGGGTSGSGNILADLLDAFRNIPFLNIVGIGGPANIGSTVQSTWDQLISGLVGEVGTGASLSDLFNIGQLIGSSAALGQMGWDILGIRSNKSLKSGLLSTSESNINLDTVASGASAPTFALTQSTAAMAFQRVSESALKGAVSWLGSGVTNITHAFVNIYKMDTTTGGLTLVHGSANIVGELSSSMQYNIYQIPDPIQVEPGEVYGIEVAVRGAGTHSIVGSSTWLPNHPSVYPRGFAAVRNSGTSAAPSTISSGSVTYASNVPFVEFAVTAGDADIPHSPQITQFTSGSSSIPIPSWANFVEVIALGGGGGGRLGGSWGISGEGGDAGVWQAATWVRGTDFTGTPSINISVGAGGAGGILSSQNGGHGSPTVVSIPGRTVTASGGEGGDALNAGGIDKDGGSPGNYTYGGVSYVGGGVQGTFGAPGAPAGGGGAGGNWVSVQPGGPGANGAVWIRFRQS